MTLKSFDPKTYKNHQIDSFVSCPGVMALFNHGSQEGHTEIYCVRYDGQKRILYVPGQQVGFLCCGSGGMRYVAVHVSEEPDTKPDYWLVVCIYNRDGYLFPIGEFTDDGNGVEHYLTVPSQQNGFVETA